MNPSFQYRPQQQLRFVILLSDGSIQLPSIPHPTLIAVQAIVPNLFFKNGVKHQTKRHQSKK